VSRTYDYCQGSRTQKYLCNAPNSSLIIQLLVAWRKNNWTRIHQYWEPGRGLVKTDDQKIDFVHCGQDKKHDDKYVCKLHDKEAHKYQVYSRSDHFMQVKNGQFDHIVELSSICDRLVQLDRACLSTQQLSNIDSLAELMMDFNANMYWVVGTCHDHKSERHRQVPDHIHIEYTSKPIAKQTKRRKRQS
jgi:hypothetical protein